MKKEKKQKKIVKPKKKTTHKKPHLRRVNGLAQRPAHTDGAEFRPTNGRSIGFPPDGGDSYISPDACACSCTHTAVRGGPAH
jgi:hypothetical protein